LLADRVDTILGFIFNFKTSTSDSIMRETSLSCYWRSIKLINLLLITRYRDPSYCCSLCFLGV